MSNATEPVATAWWSTSKVASRSSATVRSMCPSDRRFTELSRAEYARAVSTRDIVESFWAAMQDNDWRRAAGHLTERCVIDWPCSGERIEGRDDFAAIQARYPTNTGRWTFDVTRIVVEDDVAVSEVTAGDGEQSARVIAISIVVGSHIA